MSLKLGMYELFGRVIPGAFYLVAFAQMGALLNFYVLDIQALGQLQLAAILALGVIAYILGTALNLISIRWILLFKPKDALGTALEVFRKRNPDWSINFKGEDWHVLLAFIRRQNLPLADDVIERSNAFSVMLRNISLALIFLAMDQVACFATTGQYGYLVLSAIFIIISVLLGREARYFQVLFFSTIFETILSYKVNLDELIGKPKKGQSEPA